MTKHMDLQQVLDLALRIEHAAGDFYRTAAAASTDLGTRVVMNTLAQWEVSHCDAFQRLWHTLLKGAASPAAFEISAEVTAREDNRYIPPEDIARIIDACPNTEWAWPGTPGFGFHQSPTC